MGKEKADNSPKPAASTPKPTTLELEVRREVPIKNHQTLAAGEKVGVLHLRPDVDFNWLIDAARNGFVRVAKG